MHLTIWRKSVLCLAAFAALVSMFVSSRPGVAQENRSATSRSPDVIYVPTPQPVVEKMLEMAEVKKGDVVYDLGCGDGRIVVTAAKKFGAKGIGIDIDPERIAESKENVRKIGRASCRERV